ncbi:3-phosphoshikimate 1-carboxyvinyltransferase [Sporolactobacillus sp. CQH2019]|uniref:3-phosphoshikimate 1-carboxyvinyltransferase n=1 Tax=Sporolactobacillus sp. CQH2019 TaxID=3023512 RepID=UPI0023681F5E|nr:3-phosphoshikimate 1-carboxyvinyltransferase [Sporolactobacillus sp. CQH2019]MDD9148668.1 3-phosphoshikimate 1-carboxyvinyltransferase [Sporolactobacillus sp. CQH2019]
MTDLQFNGGGRSLRGELKMPGDKSISHRAVIFGAIAHGVTTVEGFLRGNDCISTLQCMRALGAKIDESGDRLIITGTGFEGLSEPGTVLDVGNSGTTIRLLSGLLSALPFYSVLAGDASVQGRPMDRVIRPLKKMGADLWGRDGDRYAPISIRGRKLHAIDYHLPMASAQVKSALILAGLQTEGKTTLTEPGASRDHTERMLRAFGGRIQTEGLTHQLVGPQVLTGTDIRVPGDFSSARIQTEGLTHQLVGPQVLTGTDIRVPGDFSSAAFFIAAALLTPGSHLVLHSVGVNPTRTGMAPVLEKMGAKVFFTNKRVWNGEPVCDIVVDYAPLHAAAVGGGLIPKLIDEIPILALIATEAEGTTVISDASELKVKETNRIRTTVDELSRIGADIEETEDGMIVHGHPQRLFTGGVADSSGDHRIGMMLAVASQKSKEAVIVRRAESIAVSFPAFREQLARIQESSLY